MKKTIKKSFIAVCSLAFAMSIGVGLNAVSASAETVAVESNFEMLDGASIRVIGNASPSGIRWSATVTQEYYDYITELDANAEFGMLVDNEEIKSVDENDSEKHIKCSAKPTFDEDGVWTYHASITYDELQAQLEDLYENDENKESKIADALKDCYETELWARAYVKYTTGGVETYEYAVEADVNRSIKGVATHCLIAQTSDVTETNKSSFVDYAGGSEYTVTEEQEFNNANAYNTTSKSGTFTAELADGDYDVYFGAKYLGGATASEGSVSVTATGFGKTKAIAGEMGELCFINDSNEVTTVPFISATHIIGDQAEGVTDAAEWQAEMMQHKNTTAGSTETADLTKDWYVVVVKDMDFGGANLTSDRPWRMFGGRFNGLGHTLADYCINNSQSSLFGGYRKGTNADHGVVIENVAFTGVVLNNESAYPIFEYGWDNGHILRNIYVEATYTVAGSKQGVWRNTAAATLENCIANLTYATPPETAYAFANDGAAGYFNDCYAVTNATTTLFSSATSEGKATPPTNVASSMNDLFPTIKADIEDEDGFGKYWSIGEYGLKFGNNEVWQNKTTLETLYEDTDTTITPETLVGGDVNKVELNGEEIAVDGAWTLDVSEYTVGEENTLTVYGNGKIVEQPFVACTLAIDTADEMVAFWTSYNGDNKNTLITSGYYVVLREDIDLNAANRHMYNDTNESDGGVWQGHFNGLGHVIANVKTNGWGGLFGSLGSNSVVENVAFVGVEHYGDAPFVFTNFGRALSGLAYIRNVYFEGISTSATSKNFALIRGGGNIRVENFIANFKTHTTGTGEFYAFWSDFAATHGSNLYVIGNLTRISATTGTNFNTQLYASVTEWATDNAANITSAKGWNMDCWHFSGSDLYFGVKKVEDITYTSVSADTIILPN